MQTTSLSGQAQARTSPRETRFRLYYAASIDGYIADVDGGVKWLERFKTSTPGFDDFFSSIDTVILGRGTYDQVWTFGEWPYAGKRTMLLTSRPVGPLPPDVRPRNVSVADLIPELQAEAAGGVWVAGGAKTMGSFLDADAADRIELHIVPVILGGGIPMLSCSTHLSRYQLAETTAFPNGVVKVVYTRAQRPWR